MPVPPKPPPPLISSVTHHSADISWEPYHQKLSSALPAEDGRLKVELQLRPTNQSEEAWDVVYKGFDTKCSVGDPSDSRQYAARYRFGSNAGWGQASEPRPFATARRPFSGEDVHRCARRQDEAELRRVLLSGEASVDAPDDKGFSSLMLAALAERTAVCDVLLEFGADVNWSGENGKTALMLVAYRGLLGSLDLLLDNGAEVGRRDRKGMTALHYAVDGEKLEAVRLLLLHSADVDAADAGGCTPLIRCAMLKNNGNPTVATALIAAGADVGRRDSSGQCSLFYCVLQRHLRMAETLLANGARPDVANDKGVTAVAVAETHDTNAMRQLLQRFQQLPPDGSDAGPSG